MKKLLALFSLLVIASLALTACGGAKSDLLADIKSRGYIMVSTDQNYPPQSSRDPAGKRPANTKCPADAITTAEMQGFDVDMAKGIGDALGVETCFTSPDWEKITAGTWGDKWDISVGSMTITPDREAVLDFSAPYYYTPAVVAVHKDSAAASVSDLAGQPLCVGDATTYKTWLEGGDLGPNIPIAMKAPKATVITLKTDRECATAVDVGRADVVGYVTSVTVVYDNIADGMAVKLLGSPVFFEPLAAALDKASEFNTSSLMVEVNQLFAKMHADGSLSALSLKWFKDTEGNGVDYTIAQ